MPRTCTVCSHPDRPAVDTALIAGEPYRDIGRRFRVSKDAVARHKDEHLPAGMVKAQEVTDVRHAIDVVQQLKAINGVCMSVLKDARDQGDGDLALKAVDRIQRQIELQAKLIGELQQEGTTNIIVNNPEWVQIRTALMVALTPFPAAAQAVAGTLVSLEGGKRHASA